MPRGSRTDEPSSPRRVPGRIRFPGNPWPAGHALVALEWTGRLVPERGLFFDLHLESADYYAEADGREDESEGDWTAPGCWGNYHACILSSRYWGQDEGIEVAGDGDPLDFRRLAEWEFHVDSDVAGVERDDHSFHIYLLGHDSVAAHRIHFTRPRGRTFALRWTAKIALTYVGKTEYEHSLVVETDEVTFEGFRIPKGLSPAAARAALARYVTGPVRWEASSGVLRPR